MRLDRNGYAPSIFPTEQGTCYICERGGDTVRHECYFGNPNRTVSKQNGFWVNLCPSCHRTVHEKTDGGEMDRYLKKQGFRIYCAIYPREKFFSLIGKYYD